MKYAYTDKIALSAKRTLLHLNNALVELLMQKDFDEITIQELCDRSMISKSSFYNYFEDKYDLLRFFFQTCKNAVTQTTDNSYTADAFPRLLDCAEQYRDVIRDILKYNKENSTFRLELAGYFNQVFERLARNMPRPGCENIPVEIRCRINAYTFLTIFEWAYSQERVVSREEVTSYLYRLYQ